MFCNWSMTSRGPKIEPRHPLKFRYGPETVYHFRDFGYGFLWQTSELKVVPKYAQAFTSYFPSEASWVNFRFHLVFNTNRNVLTRDEASFFSLSTTSSVALFNDEALDLPKEAPCESSDFLSKTNTEAAFPVDFFFASYIFQGPEVEDGEAETV